MNKNIIRIISLLIVISMLFSLTACDLERWTSDNIVPEGKPNNNRVSVDYDLESYTEDGRTLGGYTYTITLKIGPWVKHSDTEVVNSIWESIGGTGSIPFNSFTKNNWSSGVHFGKDTSIMCFGTLYVEDTTQGELSLADSSQAFSIIVDSYELDYATLVDNYIKLSSGGEFRHSKFSGEYIISVSPQMEERTWGPFPFVICADDALSPEYPDGKPDVINATWVFGDNKFKVNPMWVDE